MHIPRPIYKLRRHKHVILAVILFILPLVTLYGLKPALAAPQYSITAAAPGRIMEGQSITLTLALTGGTASTQYVFNITVTEPDASLHMAQVSFTTDGSGNGNVNANYPTQFGLPTQGNTHFVGTYQIAVDQVTPVGALNPVATGSFNVDLVNSITYQRTQTVLIQASGYGARENATVSVTFSGLSATGYPKTVMATASGLIQDSWHIPVGSRIGAWTISITGTTTLKSPADTEQFTVNVATLQITVSTDQSSYARTQYITAWAIIRYPDGSYLNNTFPGYTGFPASVTFRNGSYFRTMTWSGANWTAQFQIPSGIGSLPQTWVVQVSAFDGATYGSNQGTGQRQVTVTLYPSEPDLQITVYNSTNAHLSGVFLNVTFTNGTSVTTGYTDANGQAQFTLATAFNYYVVAVKNGYNDYLDSFYLTASSTSNLMTRDYYMSNIQYTGTILSGSYTTLSHYNPGDSGTLVVYVFNQNNTFPITITRIVVYFPWFQDYGYTYQGNTTITANLPKILNPKGQSGAGYNWTIPFTVPTDGRVYSGSGGQIYISATAPAWKRAYNITSNGPLSYKTLNTATIDPKIMSYYTGRGFLTYTNIVISFPTQDTGASAQLNIVELLLGVFLVNVILSALIWLRLRPLGRAVGLPPKV